MFDSLITQFTIIDWLFVFWMIFSVLLGLMRGFINEILSLIGWVISFTLAYKYAEVVGALIPLPINDETPAYIAGFLVILIGTMIVWTMLRSLFRFAVGKGFFDYLLGFIFGLARGFLLAVVAISVVSVLIPLPNQSWWQQAFFRDTLESGAFQLRELLPVAWSNRLQLTAEDLPDKKSQAPTKSFLSKPKKTLEALEPKIKDASPPPQFPNLENLLPNMSPSSVSQTLLPLIERSLTNDGEESANNPPSQ